VVQQQCDFAATFIVNICARKAAQPRCCRHAEQYM
jgi:hypothetical protein